MGDGTLVPMARGAVLDAGGAATAWMSFLHSFLHGPMQTINSTFAEEEAEGAYSEMSAMALLLPLLAVAVTALLYYDCLEGCYEGGQAKTFLEIMPKHTAHDRLIVSPFA